MSSTGGGNAEYATVDSRHVMVIPQSLSMLDAGGVPEVWLTAYQLLHFVGKYTKYLTCSDKLRCGGGG